MISNGQLAYAAKEVPKKLNHRLKNRYQASGRLLLLLLLFFVYDTILFVSKNASGIFHSKCYDSILTLRLCACDKDRIKP